MPGHGVPRRADRDLDLGRAGAGVVLPPLLRLPARPELGQPGGARARSRKVMAFWLQLGVSGFRIDAAPFVIEHVDAGRDPARSTSPSSTTGGRMLQWRARRRGRCSCEANVDARPRSRKYIAGRPGRTDDRPHMLFDFVLNPELLLALARGDAEPLIEALTTAAAAARARAVGDLPAQPRRARPQPADRRAARRVLRRLRARGRHAAVRTRHPPTAGADDRRRPAADRAGLRAAVLPPRHARAPLRRGDRDGRGPRPAGPRRHPHPDAVGRPGRRRLLPGGRRRARAPPSSTTASSGTRP